jgi:exodeoxyribonuclease VII large subunit
LKDLERRRLRASPLRRIQDRRQRMDELEQDMQRAFSHTILRERAALHSLALRLHSLDPRAIMRRGFAIVRRIDDGQIVDSITKVQPGLPLDITVADGHITARVEGSPPSDEDQGV